MLIVIGAFILSLIPCILLLIWLKKQNEEPAYQTSFKSAVKYGLFSVFPVIGLAAAFALISLAFPKNMPVLAREAYKDFILAAFTEEFVKFMLFRKVLKESRYNYSWRDITAFMIVIGTGFQMMESIVYALMTNPGQILVRGILIMHAGYAYIMGKYYGKALVTGKKGWYVFAFLVPFLLHGLYDYGLTPELQEWNDNTVVISVTLAFIGLITLIRLILFFRKAKKEEIYTRPLLAAVEEEA